MLATLKWAGAFSHAYPRRTKLVTFVDTCLCAGLPMGSMSVCSHVLCVHVCASVGVCVCTVRVCENACVYVQVLLPVDMVQVWAPAQCVLGQANLQLL